MPPARTGVADYSAGLVAELRKTVTVDILPEADPRYEVSIYQVGNNPLHLPAYRAALCQPGIVALHDAVLQHLHLGTLSREEYIDEFAYNYGEWMRDRARELWDSRSRSSADGVYYQYPLLRRLAERSKAVVVHNPGARRMVEAAVPSAKVVEIPHYFVPPALPQETDRTRSRLGLAPQEVVISMFGYLRESKRIGPALKALKAVPAARFLLVGQFVSQELERALQPALKSDQIIRFGYVSESEFWQLAGITDICVNLRSPSAGETSGIGIKMMGIGKPVLVTTGPETERYPELSVIRIDPGEPEAEMLAHYLRALADCREMRREIGGRAARHIVEHHTVEKAARMYLDLIA